VVTIQGKRMYLWRAVDSEGEVLDLLVQAKRDTKAALRLMRKLLKKQGFAPDVLVTDKLGSYGAARRELHLSCCHEQGLRKNNRASLFGRLKSTAFRFSDTKAATAPRALASLRIRHNGPSVMGSEERSGTI